MRSIYYHLKRGAEIEVFKINKVEYVEGNFSWGGKVERTYYSLGKHAKPTLIPEIKKYLTDKKEIEKNK